MNIGLKIFLAIVALFFCLVVGALAGCFAGAAISFSARGNGENFSGPIIGLLLGGVVGLVGGGFVAARILKTPERRD